MLSKASYKHHYVDMYHASLTLQTNICSAAVTEKSDLIYLDATVSFWNGRLIFY